MKDQGLARIFRAIAAFIFLSSNPSNLASLLATEIAIAAHGTLVIYVPTNNGLIVAADSRASVGPTLHCDDTDKIVPLRKHSRTVVVVGGYDTITMGRGKPPADPCKYRKTHPPTVTFSSLARDFLDAQSGDIGEKNLRSLETAVLNKLDALRAQYPKLKISDPDGGPVLTLTLASYDAEAHVPIFGEFSVCGDSSTVGHFFVCHRDWIRIAQTDAASLKRLGDVGCLDTKALTTRGRQLLGPQFLKEFDYFMNHSRTVSQITNKEALAVAVDLISSAERMADLTSDAPCTFIGGPIRAVLLDESHATPFKLQ